MSPQNQSQALEGEQLLDAITRHVFLVMLHISWPKMSYQIADAIVEVKVEGNGDGKEKKREIDEEFRTKPQWQLMPTEWRKKLGNLEGRARSLLSAASISFAARGISVLPVTRAQEVFQSLRSLRIEMRQYREEFVAEYESILEKLEHQLDDDLYKKVAHKLPDVEQVAKKFGVVWAIIPSGGRSGIEPQQLQWLERAINDSVKKFDDLKVARPRAIKNGLAVLERLAESGAHQVTDAEAAEVISEARDQMHQFTHEMLEEMAREPRRILTDAADNLLAALKDPERMIRNGTINQVSEAFKLVEGFEFLAGPQLLAAIHTCRQRLGNVDARQLNSDAEIGARIAVGLQGVRDEAADSRAATAALRQFRNIRIRDREPE